MRLGRTSLPSFPASTRARVLVVALGLLAGTIAVSILVDRAVLLARLDERIDRELVQEVEEFERLADQGVNPVSGQPFGDDVAAVFDTFFARNVPGDDEVILGLVAGRPYSRSPAPRFAVETQESLVAEWAATVTPTFGRGITPAGEVRWLAVPILDTRGAVAGTFVVSRFPAADRAEVDEAIRVAATVGSATFVIAAILAWAIAGRVLAPLRQLSDAAVAVDEKDLSHRIPVQGSGELADVSRRFNDMLERVERAFATQRSFLDDAGHELRTPITIVRGHLELIEPGEPLPPVTAELMLDELDRMGRIVDDLLTMAKTERPDFVVVAPVDLADLTVEMVDKARPLGPRTWEIRADALLVVDLDRQRITQAWMNLVRNAVQHTAVDDRITVFSRVAGDRVELGVADTGEGVAEADRERIFERFGRGDSARRTRTDGAGLGLAIAAAVAQAHGGTIEYRDSPGGGATFVLRLPTTEQPPNSPEEEPWPAY